MNKRQAKKAWKKISYPLVDEMNLLTLSQEEYKKAMDDFRQYLWNHCRYKHYKDRLKASSFGFYIFPAGEVCKKQFEQMIKTARKYNVTTKIIQKDVDTLLSIPGYADKLKVFRDYKIGQCIAVHSLNEIHNIQRRKNEQTNCERLLGLRILWKKRC